MKNQKVLNRDQMDPAYTWTLEDIFETDAAWEAQFQEAPQYIEAVSAMEGKVGTSAETFKQTLDALYKMELCVEELFVYARMRRDEDNTNATYQAFADRATQLLVKAQSASAFFQPEVLSIDEAVLEAFFQEDDALETYRQVVRQINDARQHTLSPAEEKLLAMAGEVAGAPDRIYTMMSDADMKFPNITVDGESVEVTHGRFIPLMESKDRDVRKAAFHAMYSTYKAWDNTVSATLSSNVKTDIFFAQARQYASSLEASLKPDDVDVAVYTSLITAIHNALPAMHKYMDIKRRALGVDEMHMYDLYVPIVEDVDMAFTYEQAKDLMVEGLAPLGDEYISAMKAGLDSGSWVDVYENNGKSSGAYSWGVWGKHPYVLMNWNDTVDNAFTLAHELGHAMHSYYSDEHQAYHNAQYRLLLAEVASTCNEAILMDYMLNHTDDAQEKKYLTNYFLEQFRTTVFRQVMFAEFEMIVHERAEQGVALTPDLFREIYHDLNVKYYGPNMVIDEEIDMEWARIPHFYRAFYVYKYATGFASAIALSRMVLEGGETEQTRYLNFLKGGGSKYPLELLKDAGVDLTTPDAVANAMKTFEELVNMMDQMG